MHVGTMSLDNNGMANKLIRRTFKRFGIIAFRRSSGICNPEGDFYRIFSVIVDCPDPVITDDGAHLGDMVNHLGTLLPGAQFHCVEPDSTPGAALESKFAGNPWVHLAQPAIGDVAGDATFNINVSRPINSAKLLEFFPR